MNDLEVTMAHVLSSSKTGLEVHRLAVEAAATALKLSSTVPKRMESLTDQLNRAACSMALNLAEGHGRFGKDRMQHWRIAYGSAKEAGTALELLASGGLIDGEAAAKLMARLDSVRAMTWRLLHPR